MLKYEPSTKNKGAAILTEHKKREREAAKEGKKPYYLKKSKIRKQTLVEKYNSLKESGKLSSYLDKRRKKNATKYHRCGPCKVIAPKYKELSEKYQDMVFLKLDCNQDNKVWFDHPTMDVEPSRQY
ncbi:PREDICTED: rRNA biogenesis protein RRP36-like [Camelina sativa]|uniref:rRNA biogenesis protein RRP36 n=1 Tax=Camelina sativa TaxID=90675 RepID=A0ABM0YK55_CAMSA|nr:PREDICTED: rRNA biogenesis protein RRP36-like [Camelina sativa]